MAINTYHCGCTTLLIATALSLPTLPRRQTPALDQAIILPLSDSTNLTSLENLTEDAPIIVRREDGFETRILRRCARCRTVIGYELVKGGKGEGGKGGDMLYVLPGWLQTTEAMAKGMKVDGKDAVLGQGESKAVLS